MIANKRIANGNVFYIRHINSDVREYQNIATGQTYRVQVIADTWQADGCKYVDVMILINGNIHTLLLDERITNQARRYTSKCIFESTQQALPMAWDMADRAIIKAS